MTLDELIAAAQAAKPKPQAVPLPELGDDAVVYVRPLTAGEVLDLLGHARAISGTDSTAARQRSAVNLSGYLCDENGNPIAPTVPEAAKLVDALGYQTVTKIVAAGNKLNGFEEKKEVEKN